jgi:hypothetical protein
MTVPQDATPDSSDPAPAADWTVLGVWDNDRAVPVGVLAGQHDVVGGDSGYWEQGLWATYVQAGDAAAAETLAVAQMQVSLPNDPDERLEVYLDPATDIAATVDLAPAARMLAAACQKYGLAVTDLDSGVPVTGGLSAESAALGRFREAVRATSRTAVAATLQTCDQGPHGFVLTEVELSGGQRLSDADPQLLADLADLVEVELSLLSWNGLVGENALGYATVQLAG